MATFIRNSETVARQSMSRIAPELTEKYATLIRFLTLNPDSAAKLKGKAAADVGTADYIALQAAGFASARTPKGPEAPRTVPDEMVSFILQTYFGVATAQLSDVQRTHQLSMAAENLIGNLLERYLAAQLEPHDWVWCSGSMVKAVDFVKAPSGEQKKWQALQVKNRDNSENSSSSAIRAGTEIQKWFRTFSKKAGSNWEAFPDIGSAKLSEAGFKIFVRNYLKNLA
ncbi:MAG: SinI family restriction endonuclease [Rhodoferax sp.]|nr:SinI family restriction endonuclease [Rhodoferax sp.]